VVRRILVIFCVFVAVAASTSATEPAKTAVAQVKAVMDQFGKAWQAKDMAALTQITAHDADMIWIGTDAAERWVGWEQLKSSLERQFAALEKLKLVPHDRVIKVSNGGDAAWVFVLWDMDVVSGGQTAKIKDMRSTFVLEKRQGHWLLVQGHFSIGVTGQAVKY
jgi:uncharacterized protein (TIGR02246 family)